VASLFIVNLSKNVELNLMFLNPLKLMASHVHDIEKESSAMRKVLGILVFLMSLSVFQIIAEASSFTFRDDFSSPAHVSERVLSNLRINSQGQLTFAGFDSGPDPAHGYSATATYTLSGVRTVRLGIYSWAGTFAQNDPVHGLSLGYGSLRGSGNTPHILPSRVAIGRLNGIPGVFAHIDDLWLPLYWDMNHDYLRFRSNFAAPQITDARNYGVNVFADGRPIALTRVAHIDYSRTNGRIYEEFTALIPDGVSMITIEINDFHTLPMYPAGIFTNLPARTMGLAFVEFTGEHITPSEPELVVTAPPPEPSQRRRPHMQIPPVPPPTAASPPAAGSSSGSAARPAGGYFVGTPMPPPISNDNPSEPAAAESVRVQVPVPRAAVSEQPQQTQTEATQPVVYQVRRPAENNNSPFITGAVLYMVLAGIIMAAVILKGKK